ncbi:MAG: DUF927 domain-containing protein [Anaerolineae bacterium]|nr:DUF927 domain-containing protein [Anaerolineae bacterium]
MSIAQTDASGNQPEWRDFLRALYSSAPDDLYFELRCIHPTTGDARSFWSKVGDKHTLTNALNRATALNRESGYGLYFAPCLRSQKQGKAEAAALLPALWVDLDCDDDSARRAGAMAKLHAFNPLPSAIIDSGGGLHAYWLLNESTSLIDEAARKQAAGMLRGLFSALGGDPQYVKSVASVMRLAGSINTKPERGGVVVTLVELHPDRRYPMSDFGWLESQPQVEGIGSLNVVTLNGNRQHPLPKRTEGYLVSGATEGSRNTELFQAACQLRDAGYSESDAEAQLVARYVADGCSEKEALATIRSAYSRPPRDPIPSPRDQVEQLVNRYSRRDEQGTRPMVDEIREAVKACATLDPLAWAETRQQLRAIAGDTFRVQDLNQMYQQARREANRSQMTESLSAGGRYLETETGIVYEKMTERGLVRQPVTDWTGRIIEWITRVDDDGQEEHVMRTQVQHPMHTTTLDIPGELFGDSNGFGRFITGRASGIFTVYPAMHRHLPHAIQSLSGTIPRKTTYRFLGWAEHEGKRTFLTPGTSISAAGALPEPPEVELENRLSGYGLVDASWEDSLTAFNAAVAVFPPHMASALTAFSLLPLVQRFFPPAAMRPALHLVGTTGSGKSEIAALMTSFYGQFTRDTPPAQWGDTVNTVEVLGYALADALFWVDDWKPCYSDEKTFTRFLHAYSRGMGRGRLTKDSKVRQDRPCRGLLLSTGETTIEGEASILARMLVLEIPPWEKRDPGGKRLALADAHRSALPGFTAHFARWIAAQVEAGTLQSHLAREYELSVKGYRDKLTAQLGRQANTGRVIGNWATLITVYRLLRQFLEERDGDDGLPAWQDSIVQTAKAVQEERAGQVFIDTLGQLLASGDVRLVDLDSEDEVKPGTPIIGYQDRRFIYLLPEISLREVKPTQSLNFTTKSIGDQLREDGWLIPNTTDGRLTIQKRLRGNRTWVWCLKRQMLGDDTDDSGDADAHEKHRVAIKA